VNHFKCVLFDVWWIYAKKAPFLLIDCYLSNQMHLNIVQVVNHFKCVLFDVWWIYASNQSLQGFPSSGFIKYLLTVLFFVHHGWLKRLLLFVTM